MTSSSPHLLVPSKLSASGVSLPLLEYISPEFEQLMQLADQAVVATSFTLLVGLSLS